VWYVSVAVNKTYAVAWIKQMKHVLVLVLKGAKGLKVCLYNHHRRSIFILVAVDVDCLHL